MTVVPFRRPRPANPGNWCSSCGQDFSSVSLFDRHRIGRHEYTYLEGVTPDPPREDGRRCLLVEEIEEKGWALDGRQRWSDPAKVEQARRAFAETASFPAQATDR
jgi:hypothetical protein